MRYAFEQRSPDPAEAALRITDRSTGAPRNRTRRDRVGHATLQRHRRPAPASRTDDEVGPLERMQQRRQAGGIVLAIGIHGDDRVESRTRWRISAEHLGERRLKRRPLASIGLMPQDLVGTTGDRSREGAVS